jgi:hypothetical protein
MRRQNPDAAERVVAHLRAASEQIEAAVKLIEEFEHFGSNEPGKLYIGSFTYSDPQADVCLGGIQSALTIAVSRAVFS